MPRSKTQTEQIRAESREKILDTARRLFAERGYGGCNISDIARQAGMSQGNIYWYFPSKEALFKAVLVEGFEALGGMMAGAAEHPGIGIEKVDHFLTNFMNLMKEGGDAFVIIVITFIAQGGVKRFGEFGISPHEIGAGYHQSLNQIIAQGQAEGAFTPGVAPDVLSTFFFSFMNGLVLMYPDQWRDIPYPTIRAAVLHLLGAETRP